MRAEHIITVITNYYHTDISFISNNNRLSKSIKIRFTIYYFLRKHTLLTLTSIGKIFNKRHGTVLNALQKASDLMSYDVAYKKEILDICRLLNVVSNEVIIDNQQLCQEIIYDLITTDVILFKKLNITQEKRHILYEFLKINNEQISKIENGDN